MHSPVFLLALSLVHCHKERVRTMFSYTDLNGYGVDLSFKKDAFHFTPTHVLVLAKQQGRWLLTKHPKRGYEFPGGKQEAGETLVEAAKREVYEETGAHISNVTWLATYVVQEAHPFGKAVYVADVTTMDRDYPLHETEGAVLMTDDELLHCDELSFHMRDVGMKKILEKVSELEDKWRY